MLSNHPQTLPCLTLLPALLAPWTPLLPCLQELANDPLGILRPASKLQHQLPLASAYAAVAAAPDNDHGMQRQKRRLDPVTGEPRWAPAVACSLLLLGCFFLGACGHLSSLAC
jgi:hypothetical protein